ncbi:MAG: alpha/beta hydrolase [Coriobacteriales bacterium]|jgi:pimeloyl-ACP methyl ester carboxylesterase|nr:alpha/beta hydrolase [Coriobacteriales bacterium]
MNNALLLDQNDFRVLNARKAENGLRQAYQVAGKDHYLFLKTFGIHIRVCEYGTGEPVLIVPGNTGDSFVFMPLIAQLTGRKVLALNRPGGGLSEGFNHHATGFKTMAINTIDTILEYFRLGSVPIIAHSMGGHWSLWYAIARPQRVESLTLLGVPGNVMNCKPPFALRLASVPGLNRLLFSRISPKTASTALRGLRLMGHSNETIVRLPSAMADCYFHFQKLPHYETSSLSLMETTNTLFGSKADIRITESELGKVRQNVSMIWGTNDPFGSVKNGEEIVAALPNPMFHTISDGGHLPWLDSPKQCGKLIAEFLG